MRLQLGRTWRRSLSTSLVLVASAGALGATVGCSRHQETVLDSSGEAATLGQVRLNLTATSANGVVYRLSNATFEITSTTSSEQVTISTDEHPEDSVLLIDLPADDYEVELQPGWVLSTVEEAGGLAPSARRRAAKPVPFSALRAAVERPNDVASGAAPASNGTLGTVVEAELISDNPVAVTVVAEELALVSFVFRANGEVIDTGAGTLGIGFEVEDEPQPPTNSCCEASGTPGCSDPAVNECVCALDPFCCDVEFDGLCVDQAITACDAQCAAPEPEPQSDCCSPSEEPACAVPEVSACVCELDAFCCEVQFDEICTQIAASECGMVCSG